MISSKVIHNFNKNYTSPNAFWDKPMFPNVKNCPDPRRAER